MRSPSKPDTGAGKALSRRSVLTGLAATCVAASAKWSWATEIGGGPSFFADGPDAELYGAGENYPIKDWWRIYQPGNPASPKYRVGAFSHYDEIFPTRHVDRAATAWPFKRTPADVSYQYKGNRASLADYLARNPVTGLLIAKDDRILVERYQYGRTDRERLMSQSMAKSITGMLIGIATAEGAVKSIDDAAETYVPGLKGTEYGATPIRALLHMSSGVKFGEENDEAKGSGDDLDRLWGDMVRKHWFSQKGTVASIAQFNQRIAPPGTRFHYASIETDVLGLVLRYATGQSMCGYLQEKVWQPIGTEADAKWLIDAEGREVAHGFFNAVLRDYARLARLLAHDGAWEGKQIIPAQWMIDATTVRASETYLAKAEGGFGYGYQVYLFPGSRRQFALLGHLGQRILVDPPSKLVMVQTAVDEKSPEIWRLWSAVVAQFG
jgi:CubicO group peptidase (beta-lactamase class C family)